MRISRNHPAIARAVKFIYDEQEDDGSWFGRWGVNYVYGCGAVIPALVAVGDTKETPRIRKALDWLASKQNPDGGWGETIASYMEPKYAGTGIPSTASQTAWALGAYLAVGDKNYDKIIRKACEFLVSSQKEDGTWDEPYYTGTGFPGYGLGAKIDLRNGAPLPQGKELARGFMLNYNWYRHYFPLTSLGRAENISKPRGKHAKAAERGLNFFEMTDMKFSICLAAAAIALCGCAKTCGIKEAAFASGESRAEIECRACETFAATLPSNPTTGYGWAADCPPA